MCLIAQSYPTLCDPTDCSLPGSFVHGDSLGKNTGVGCYALLQGLFPNPGTEPRSPAEQADSLLSETPGEALSPFSFLPSALSKECNSHEKYFAKGTASGGAVIKASPA